MDPLELMARLAALIPPQGEFDLVDWDQDWD